MRGLAMAVTVRSVAILAMGASTVASVLAPAVACAADAAPGGPMAGFSKLVALSATRLEISRKVALTKWDSHQPVADPPQDPREKQVIQAASDEAARMGLTGDIAPAFFSDQIEASKLIQFALMADWQRDGRAPPEARADLKNELRPALDALRKPFIEELVATQSLRAAADCKRQVAQAAQAYGRSHRLPALYLIALDRGLARVCGD